MGKPIQLYRLRTRDPYFPPGKDFQTYAKIYGSGVLFAVFRDCAGQILVGNGSENYPLEEVIERCQWAKLKLMLYVSEHQKQEDQLECARVAIQLATHYKMFQIAILSPETEFLVLVRQMESEPVKVLTGRLAGHLVKTQNLTNEQLEEEIKKEAAKGTSIIAFYDYEHGTRAIMSMIRTARRYKIKIFFNIRSEKKPSQDVLKHAVMIARMAAKNGGGVFCNHPLDLLELLRKTKSRPGK